MRCRSTGATATISTPAGICSFTSGAEQARKRDFRGPDFYVVLGVPRHPTRRFWVTWLEGDRFPDFILELTSPTTEKEDRTIKKAIYERTFHTREYFLHDPETNRTEGWRLDADQRYQPIDPDARGWFWCETLNLWLGLWEGTFEEVTEPALWPRFFTPDGQLVRLSAEAQGQRAEAERQRTDTERQAHEAAEAEIARLRALLKGAG